MKILFRTLVYNTIKNNIRDPVEVKVDDSMDMLPQPPQKNISSFLFLKGFLLDDCSLFILYR